MGGFLDLLLSGIFEYSVKPAVYMHCLRRSSIMKPRLHNLKNVAI